jgi:hypothetical protein
MCFRPDFRGGFQNDRLEILHQELKETNSRNTVTITINTYHEPYQKYYERFCVRSKAAQKQTTSLAKKLFGKQLGKQIVLRGTYFMFLNNAYHNALL